MQKQIMKPSRSLKKTAELAATFLSEENRDVLFFDEGRFGLLPTIGRYWGLKGEKQHVEVVTKYTFFYIYAGVSPVTGDSFVLYLPFVNTTMMELYLEHISAEYAEKHLLIIMDQAGWHKAQELQVPHNIHIEFLPSYSPELNPAEKVWQWLRQKVCRNKTFATENELMDALTSAFREMTPSRFKQLCNCDYLLQYK